MKKVIVITGGSDGLGKSIAKELSDNDVIILARDYDKLEKAAEELDCDFMTCDVTNPDNIEKTIKSILDKYGKIDVLINNAGVWLAGDITENDYDKISTCIDVNTKGPIYMTKAVLPSMYERKEGLIINVCSQASFDNDDFSSERINNIITKCKFYPIFNDTENETLYNITKIEEIIKADFNS